jgi:hypothetical protein
MSTSSNGQSLLLTNLAAKTLIFLLSLLAPSLLFAQANQKAPTGKEIASEVKNYHLLNQAKKTEVINGKKISVTPAEIIDSTQSQDGVFLGVLENEIPGVETGLPPGRYNLFFAYVDKKPHIYAESNGKIVKEGLRVSVERLKDKPNPKDQVVIKGKGLASHAYFQYYWGTSMYSSSSYISVVGGYGIGGSGYFCPYCFSIGMFW